MKRLRLPFFGSLFLACCGSWWLAAPGRAQESPLSGTGELEVRILYDDSGSMYPGYRYGGHRPPGTSYFRRDPEFRSWLADFVAAQSILDGRRVSLAALTSNADRFLESDLQLLGTPFPLREFDGAVFDRLPAERAGRHTYLAQALDSWTRGYQGLFWLITDNYPDSGAGAVDQEVVEFFRSLFATDRFRSVHLFKLPFAAGAAASDLAVYGLVVSAEPVAAAELSALDQKFRDVFRLAERQDGRPLFEGQKHRKLKDWRLDPLVLELRGLEPQIFDTAAAAREQEPVALEIPGVLRSLLSQYTVTSGRYRIEAIEPFVPDDAAQRDLGVGPLPSETFAAGEGAIEQPIPPNGEYAFHQPLVSLAPIELELGGFAAWVRTALTGARVTFTGRVKIELFDLDLAMDHDQMDGIFGIEHAAEIFGFPETVRLAPQEDTAIISFVVETGQQRGLLLLLFLLPPLALAILLGALLRGPAHFRVTVGDNIQMIALRRWQERAIQHRQYLLGRLRRGLSGEWAFESNQADVAVRITAESREGWYQVQLRDQGTVTLHIEKLQGGRAPAGPGPGPPGPSRPLPIRRP